MAVKRKSEEFEEGCENIDPNVPKKKRLSLSLKNKKGSRFGTISDEQLKSMTSYVMPKNSATSSRWALKNLSDWRQEHNNQNPEKPCPEEILSPSCNKALLNEWLCVYIAETISHSGEWYPPKTIHALLCGILREMQVKNSEYPNFKLLWTTCLNSSVMMVLVLTPPSQRELLVKTRRSSGVQVS